MEENLPLMASYAVQFMPYAAAGLAFLLLAAIPAHHPEILVLRACDDFVGLLRKGRQTRGWYQKTASWLLKNGGEFHYGGKITPVRYLALCMVLGAAGFIIGSLITPQCGAAVAAVCVLLPRFFLEYLNRRDNERMLSEIKLVYHALELQIRAGVYVADALAECYGSVGERRLQKGLLDLAGDIVMKSDLKEALEHFQGSFDNRYIDALCITVLQALESGQAVELLCDIGEQIKDMESAVLERRKSSLDRSITFYQLGILAAVLGVALYACVTHMFSAALHF